MSRYTTYADFITDIAAEAGESGTDLDTLILNLCKSVVDYLNTIRHPAREAQTTIAVGASDYDYPLATYCADFNEVIDHRSSLYYRNGGSTLFIPIERSRREFLKGWNPSTAGSVYQANIFGNVLYLKNTPSEALTAYLEYYKNLAVPATGGTVLIPDQYLSLARMEIMGRLEAYNESENFTGKSLVFAGIKTTVLYAIQRDYLQNSLPGEVEQEGDDF